MADSVSIGRVNEEQAKFTSAGYDEWSVPKLKGFRAC